MPQTSPIEQFYQHFFPLTYKYICECIEKGVEPENEKNDMSSQMYQYLKEIKNKE